MRLLHLSSGFGVAEPTGLRLASLDIELLYYDLGILNRDKTDDQVTEDAAYANLKCAA